MNKVVAQARHQQACFLNQTFDSFGYEAEETYANLQDESNEQRYYFFKHFKMALHNDEVRIAISTTLVSISI